MGLFLGGHLEATPSSDPFTSSVFHFPEPKVIVRISPMISGPKNLPFDLHGISVRIQPNDNAADITDLVALNTHPFMFRNADDFALFLSRMHSGPRQMLIGFWAFGLAAVAGNASISAMANAIYAMAGANNPLTGRSYWGMNTFFADRLLPSGETARVPYRYRLEIRKERKREKEPLPGKVLGRYCDIVRLVEDGSPLLIDLRFGLPWRWERLVDWSNVPVRIRDKIINPQNSWKYGPRIHMATLVLDIVLDANAFEGRKTERKYDNLLFDPTRLSDGLHVSEDPLLRARSGIYAESHMRRASD
jgi:hypothetical protein